MVVVVNEWWWWCVSEKTLFFGSCYVLEDLETAQFRQGIFFLVYVYVFSLPISILAACLLGFARCFLIGFLHNCVCDDVAVAWIADPAVFSGRSATREKIAA